MEQEQKPLLVGFLGNIHELTLIMSVLFQYIIHIKNVKYFVLTST